MFVCFSILENCFLQDVFYPGDNVVMVWSDLPDYPMSSEECQKSCQKYSNCDTFSYIKKDYKGSLKLEKGACYMKKASDTGFRTSKDVGIISGPRYCNG